MTTTEANIAPPVRIPTAAQLEEATQATGYSVAEIAADPESCAIAAMTNEEFDAWLIALRNEEHLKRHPYVPQPDRCQGCAGRKGDQPPVPIPTEADPNPVGRWPCNLQYCPMSAWDSLEANLRESEDFVQNIRPRMDAELEAEFQEARRQLWQELQPGVTPLRNPLTGEYMLPPFPPPGRRSPADDSQIPDEDAPIPLGEHDPKTGKLVLSPKRTLPTAEVFVKDSYTKSGERTLLTYAGVLMVWAGNGYSEIEDDSLRQQLFPWLHGSLQYHTKKNSDLELIPFPSNPSTVDGAIDTVKSYTHLPATVTPPFWLPGAERMPCAPEILSYKSGNLHIPSGEIIPATPRLFATSALPFDYDPHAAQPAQWLAFLKELRGEDAQSIALLQEWFGYCLTPDTSQQKALLIIGPPRSGKGSIARVLTELIGTTNVVGPTINSLAGPFGLQPLIGKSLAIVSDARFAGQHVPIAVERLLCITGEDYLTVDRKNKSSVTMKLGTRIVVLSNELPRFKETSGALAGRFVILRLTRSFSGKEDVALTAKLITELPGILLWALVGRKRLWERGHFVAPANSREAAQQLHDYASPVSAFIAEQCIVGDGHRASSAGLYTAYRQWCEAGGLNASSLPTFGIDLRAAVPGVTRHQTDEGRFYKGIALKK